MKDFYKRSAKDSRPLRSYKLLAKYGRRTAVDDEKKDNQEKSNKKSRGGKNQVNWWFIVKAIVSLIFICAILYLCGFVWVVIQGSNAPEGIQWMYPFVPK